MQIDNILSKLQDVKNWLLSYKIGDGWPHLCGRYYKSNLKLNEINLNGENYAQIDYSINSVSCKDKICIYR